MRMQVLRSQETESPWVTKRRMLVEPLVDMQGHTERLDRFCFRGESVATDGMLQVLSAFRDVRTSQSLVSLCLSFLIRPGPCENGQDILSIRNLKLVPISFLLELTLTLY